MATLLCLQCAVASSYGVVIVQASMLCVAVSFEHAATWSIGCFLDNDGIHRIFYLQDHDLQDILDV